MVNLIIGEDISLDLLFYLLFFLNFFWDFFEVKIASVELYVQFTNPIPKQNLDIATGVQGDHAECDKSN